METATMCKPSSASCPPLADAVEQGTAAPTEDPAGGIVLSGRNHACARTRVLAGMLLTSGVVAALGVLDTTSSMLGGHMS
jgi:hypothetical protein